MAALLRKASGKAWKVTKATKKGKTDDDDDEEEEVEAAIAAVAKKEEQANARPPALPLRPSGPRPRSDSTLTHVHIHAGARARTLSLPQNFEKFRRTVAVLQAQRTDKLTYNNNLLCVV